MRPLHLLCATLAIATFAPAASTARWSQTDLAALADVVAGASGEGLTDDYGATPLTTLTPGDQADTLANAIALRLAKDFYEGSARMRADQTWHIARGTLDYDAWLTDVLARRSVRSSFHVLLPSVPAYTALKKGLARCQAAGRECGTIIANLDRLRALPRDLGQRYLWVDVPAFRLDLIEGGRVVASHRIIVGKAGTQTPSFRAIVTGVTVNPWWNVPCSIVNESVGKLITSNPAEAARRGYVASRDVKGQLVVRQKPGPNNALGQIKLEMPNRYGVYIHDTPSRDLFTRNSRAFSHGCIRTEDPKSLAAMLLGEGKANSVDLLLASGATKTLAVNPQVPVYVLYLTAEPDKDAADGIALHPDIYGRDLPYLAKRTSGK